MRVLFWSELFWPHVGGVEILAAQTVEGLCARGIELTVITSHDDSIHLPDRGDHAGAVIQRLPFRAAIRARDLAALMSLRGRVHQLKAQIAPHLIHLFGLGPSSLFHLQTQSASPAPVLVTMHGEVLRGGADGGDTVLEKTLASASAVACVSAAVLEATRAIAPDLAGRSSLLYSGIQPLGLPGSSARRSRFLLCLGRFVRDKGFDLAISAFASIADSFPALRLVLAGDGPLRPELETQVAAAGLGDRVEFVGWVDNTQVAELLGATSLLLMPSRREGLPLVAIQAAQAGVPVVGTVVGGLPEVVVDGETGLLVPSDDAEALARSIAHLLNEEDTVRRMRATARRRATDIFGWERYLDAIETLYTELIARAGFA